MKATRKFLAFILVTMIALASCSFGSTSSLTELPPNNGLLYIAVETLPNKLIYFTNDDLDLTGGKIIVAYQDETIELKPILISMVVSKVDMTRLGLQTIVLEVSHLDITKQTKFTISIEPRVVFAEKVEIYNQPEKLIVSDNIRNLTLYKNVLPTLAANQEVVWSSDNQAVLNVDQMGFVSILSSGIATITLAMKANPEIKDQIQIFVAKQQDLLGINELVTFLNKYYEAINASDYTAENYLLLVDIYETAIFDLNQQYLYKDANTIYLKAYQDLANIDKKITYSYIPPSYQIPTVNYAQYTLEDGILTITSGGLVNQSLIGVATVDKVIVAATVNDATVTIQNIIVTNDIDVLGGGENSVILNTVDATDLNINKTSGEVVKVEINGGSYDQVNVYSAASLVINTNLTNIDINNQNDLVTISGNGSITELQTNTDLDLNLAQDLTNLIIKDGEDNISVNLESEVTNLEVGSPLTLTGNGFINNVITYQTISNYLNLGTVIVPCECPRIITFTNYNDLIHLKVFKAGTIITGPYHIDYVTNEIGVEEVIYLNTPDTIFFNKTGLININGFEFFVQGAERATDPNGDFTCEYCLEVYRTLVLNALNNLVNTIDPKVYLPVDYQYIIDAINGYKVAAETATTPLAVQAIDNVIPNIPNLKPIHKYIKDIESFTLLEATRLYQNNMLIELAQTEVDEYVVYNFGTTRVINNLDEVEMIAFNYLLKVTDPVQNATINLKDLGQYELIYELQLINGYLNPDAIDLTINFVVKPQSEVTKIPSFVEFIDPVLNKTIMFEDDVIINYAAIVKDQFGEVMPDENVTFQMQPATGMVLNPNGTLIIDPTTIAQTYQIYAVAVSDNLISNFINLILIYEPLVPTTIEIEGPDEITVMLYATNYEVYDAIVKDQYGNNLSDQEINWQIEVMDGVTLNINNFIEVTVANTVIAETVTLTATVAGSDVTTNKLITLIQEQQIITQVFIGGPDSVKLKKTGDTTANFSATIIDQYGVLIEGISVTWSLILAPDGVSIDINGRVTLTKNVIATEFTIKVEVTSIPEIFATKTVIIQPA